MMPFNTLTSVVAPLNRDNIDTDIIIPSREMRSTGRTGLADGLFAPWRYSDAAARTENPDFVLNQPEYRSAQILASGANFGCGSSREHAVWALAEHGIRCVIAESFAPIFYNNCIRNGLAAIVLPRAVIGTLAGGTATVDLAGQTVNGHSFEIGAEAKMMLLEGLDAIDLTLKHRDAITAWQGADRMARPWIYLQNPLQAQLGEGDRPKDGGGVAHLPPRTNAAVLRARKLRREMSLPEVMLWQELRKRPGGLKFRRQHPAAAYTLDFYCAAAKLCIEVDGEHHSRGTNPQQDAKRDNFMRHHGIETIRLTATDVIGSLENTVRHIVAAARARIPLHRPSDGPPPHSLNGEDL
jgi:3-isopropylmalate/(R)-2-methylmalate dehydratase small subunit